MNPEFQLQVSFFWQFSMAKFVFISTGFIFLNQDLELSHSFFILFPQGSRGEAQAFCVRVAGLGLACRQKDAE